MKENGCYKKLLNIKMYPNDEWLNLEHKKKWLAYIKRKQLLAKKNASFIKSEKKKNKQS